MEYNVQFAISLLFSFGILTSSLNSVSGIFVVHVFGTIVHDMINTHINI